MTDWIPKFNKMPQTNQVNFVIWSKSSDCFHDMHLMEARYKSGTANWELEDRGLERGIEPAYCATMLIWQKATQWSSRFVFIVRRGAPSTPPQLVPSTKHPNALVCLPLKTDLQYYLRDNGFLFTFEKLLRMSRGRTKCLFGGKLPESGNALCKRHCTVKHVFRLAWT